MSRMKHVEHETCQGWNMSRMKHVKDETCQGWKMSRVKHVKDETCQGWNMSRIKHVKDETCQGWSMSRMKHVKDEACQGSNMSRSNMSRIKLKMFLLSRYENYPPLDVNSIIYQGLWVLKSVYKNNHNLPSVRDLHKLFTALFCVTDILVSSILKTNLGKVSVDLLIYVVF